MRLLNSKKHYNVHQRVNKFVDQNSNYHNQIYFDCVMLIVVASKLKRCLFFITRFYCVETNAKTNAKTNEFVCEIVTKTNDAKSTNETNTIESIITKIK